MRHLIIGGAGCIGSELAQELVVQGEKVRVLDNLSSGRIGHLSRLIGTEGFEFIEGDVLDHQVLSSSMEGIDRVWHLSAKTDIKFLSADTYDFEADLRENFLSTWGVLQAMRRKGVGELAFASSAAVYGEMPVIDEEFLPEPVSVYGATKLASEAVIRAMSLRMGWRAWMFRFCSIVSPRARKSGNMVIPDLIHKLQKDPSKLEILGDGHQTKPSLLVGECVEAMLHIVSHSRDQVSITNIGPTNNGIGPPDVISVQRQAQLICEAMGAKPKMIYSGGKGGWPGDVPSFSMHTQKLADLGWRARLSSEEAVRKAIQGILESGE